MSPEEYTKRRRLYFERKLLPRTSEEQDKNLMLVALLGPCDHKVDGGPIGYYNRDAKVVCYLCDLENR
jgi:hypothetical protein